MSSCKNTSKVSEETLEIISKGPKKVAFIVHSETYLGKGIYEIYKVMKAQGHDVKILAIPIYVHDKLISNVDLEYLKRFDSADVIYPCGKSPPYDSCELPKDYILITFLVKNHTGAM